MYTFLSGNSRRLWYWLRVAFAMGMAVVVVGVANQIFPLNTSEDGFIEAAELIVIIGMVLAWAIAAVKAERSHVEFRAGIVAICLTFTAVSFAGVGRETTWGAIYGLAPATVNFFMMTSAVIVILLFVTAVTLVVTHFEDTKTSLRNLITSRPMGWISCGLILFAIGAAFEENLFGVEPHELFEEVFELLAYLSVIFAAVSLISTLGTNPSAR
ncbi:hypothetical protein AB9F29_10545 [Falsihalocynthiibacter sp. S25ZX9]|uniref:hypothetical protein n=1 Tax=Falsihalocynthiibacter sp. S25ZX9 TaxID=3240870 RepID=UPI00350EFF36